MRYRISLVLFGLLVAQAGLQAQGRGGGRGGPPAAPKAAAPIDLTGYWVSVVTEDWRYRMVTPAPGDYQGVPMTQAALKIADAWDPTKEEASGDVCKSYGAPSILRVPEHLHITWQDDSTLKIETDTGMQTRLLHFGGKPLDSLAPSREGYSAAQWEQAERGIGAPRPGFGATREGNKGKALEAVTTHLLPGYLRKNGFPVSGNAVVKEDFDLFTERTGQVWFVVTTIVEDPLYLQEPFVTSSNFKKQPDAAGWKPRPCSAR